MRLNKPPLPEPVRAMQHDVPAQRLSLAIKQESTAGLNVSASRTAVRKVPSVVLLQARENPFELEWKLTPAQAGLLADKLLQAVATCHMMDEIAAASPDDSES
jgi:hypothetical protein